MRLTIAEQWSHGSSAIHARDPRAKLGVLLALLIAITTTAPEGQAAFLGFAGFLLMAAVVARLPLGGVLWRAALVLPFSAALALAAWQGEGWSSGGGWRALALAERSYLAALAAVVFVGTTPVAAWTSALEALHWPRGLVLVMQFLHRYLFVIADQAGRMRQAARARGGFRFRAAAGAAGVLFARSWQRAEGVSRAMQARGFRGSFPRAALPAFRVADAAFLGAGVAMAAAIRLAL